jgi:hypothetical protein
VSCTSTASCVAVGHYDASGTARTLIESWNGTTWSTVISPNQTSEDNDLTGVSCTGSRSCLAAGYYSYGPQNNPLALVEAWNGSVWSIAAAPARSNDSMLHGMFCTSASSCVAVGDDVNSSHVAQTLIESWDGAAWSITSSSNVGTGSALSGVSCEASAHCMAAGMFTIHGVSQTLIESGPA